MLIEFSVENFRSIKDEVTLSMVANHAKEHRNSHVFVPEVAQGVRSDPLLRSAVIYGPNAGGKTNLILALHAMQTIIVRPDRKLENLPLKPFLFCEESKDKPTTFNLTGIVNHMQFQYGFTATQKLVSEEWLYTWPKGRLQRWFERTTDSNEVKCKFGEKLGGDKKVWQKATRPDALLLTTAITLNSKQLRPIFDWFRKKLVFGGIGGWGKDFTKEWCEGDNKKKIVEFLRSVDFAIEDLRISKKNMSTDSAIIRPLLGSQRSVIPLGRDELYFLHQTQQGNSEEINFEDESDGTQKIFELAGPWISTIEDGRIIIYDELHEHLHPTLLRYLISQFHRQESKNSCAQLVFTTHDTSILTQELFRRDQIWFCERNSRQETKLNPLTDFSPRRGYENLSRSYLGGRYGALPYPINLPSSID